MSNDRTGSSRTSSASSSASTHAQDDAARDAARGSDRTRRRAIKARAAAQDVSYTTAMRLSQRDAELYPQRPDHPDFWVLSKIAVDRQRAVQSGTAAEVLLAQAGAAPLKVLLEQAQQRTRVTLEQAEQRLAADPDLSAGDVGTEQRDAAMQTLWRDVATALMDPHADSGVQAHAEQALRAHLGMPPAGHARQLARYAGTLSYLDGFVSGLGRSDSSRAARLTFAPLLQDLDSLPPQVALSTSTGVHTPSLLYQAEQTVMAMSEQVRHRSDVDQVLVAAWVEGMYAGLLFLRTAAQVLPSSAR